MAEITEPEEPEEIEKIKEVVIKVVKPKIRTNRIPIKDKKGFILGFKLI